MHLFISFLCGILLYFIFSYVPYSSALIFSAASFILIRKKKALLIPLVLFGILYAFLVSGPAGPAEDLHGRHIRATGFFQHHSGADRENAAADVFRIETAFDRESGEELDGLEDEEIYLVSDSPVDDDTGYELDIEAGRGRRRSNPGGFSTGHLLGRVTGIAGTRELPVSPFAAVEGFRKRLHEYLFMRFPGDSAALVAALTTGETALLSDELKASFNRSGLAHILSISGTHFGLFSVLLFTVARFVILRLPYRLLQRLTLLMTPSQAAALFSLPFMVMYLAISGGSVPAVRSFVMIGLFLLGLLLGRKGVWLNSLLFAAVLLALWDPGVVLSLSFQLSFIAVLFIGFSIVPQDERKTGRRLPAWVRNSLRLTAAATLGTAPLVAYHFHYLSLISPLANLVIAPLIGFGVIPLALVSSFIFLFTGQYLFAPVVEVLTGLSLSLVRWTAGIPFASVPVASFPPLLVLLFYGCFIAFFSFRSGRPDDPDEEKGERPGTVSWKLLIIPFLPFLVYAFLRLFETKELTITFLDAGQGDAALIELPDGRTIAVDTGRSGRELLGFLAYSGKEEIDALLLTHIHPDHTGGLASVLKGTRVRELWDNGLIIYPGSLGQLPPVRHLERGDTIEGSGYRITVLHPHRSFYTMDGTANEEENNSSVVLKVAGQQRSVLLAGDAGEEAAEDMLHLGSRLKADVIKVPHHGSDRSLHEQFLQAVSPSVAVISVGRDNAFGHPGREVIDALKGAWVLRTDQDGAVKIRVRGSDVVARTYREYLPVPTRDLAGETRTFSWLISRW